MSGRIRIGTRGSDLALWQARHIIELLSKHRDVTTETIVIHTQGDRLPDQPIALGWWPSGGFVLKIIWQENYAGCVSSRVTRRSAFRLRSPIRVKMLWATISR